MDPIAAGLLVAVATGAAGEAGRQLWDVLGRLVRRAPEPGDGTPDTRVPATGEAELAALDEAPHDMERARRLSEALGHRAVHDSEFRAELAQWQHQARILRTGDGETSNTISGGVQHGPVLQGRDFSEIHFNGPQGA
ncbi:hypothetical protein SUDANB145_03569 [Streptomyces sp. enrichment culture]|uniref:hypothetical protein n=1 Tax=Streptomyces sp. enrichment culture TaxID=1795815 RepID=UPI003F568A1C